ncbi:hypothetical protein ACS0TY_018121 [Phlomoides rotata]
MSSSMPISGMYFQNIESLFEAYQEHVKHKGYCIIKRTCHKSGPMGYKYAQMTCDKSRKSITHKTSKMVSCTARLNAIKQDDGSWIISKVVSEHNHEINPNYSILMPAHRRIPVHMRRQLEANDIVGIRPYKNVRLCKVQSGGPMNLGCSPKDCRNLIDHRRRLRLGEGDVEAIRRMFARIQQKDRDFFYLMDIDDQVFEGANSDGIEQFKVLERSIMNNFYLGEFTYTVEYKPNGSYISCDCKKFKFKGILCCHIMKVMALKDIQIVNDRYLLRRWRKDVYRRHSSIFFAGGYPHMTNEYKKFQEVERYFQECADVAMDDVSKMEFIKRKCIEMKSELLNWNPEMAANKSVPMDTTSVDVGGILVMDPRITNSRGRVRNNHYLSSREINTR